VWCYIDSVSYVGSGRAVDRYIGIGNYIVIERGSNAGRYIDNGGDRAGVSDHDIGIGSIGVSW